MKPIITIVMLSLLLMAPGFLSYAASDDPGAGRLSGKDVPEEFYDDSNNTPNSLLGKYGLTRYGTYQAKSPYTNLTYTHQNVFSGDNIINGIDVSYYQKTIDWQKVKAAGIDFAFIRVGYRGYGKAGTLSEATKDTCYETNMKNATAAGVKVGVYIFSQAITVEEAVEEADYILNHLGSYQISMPLIMDYEYASGTSDGGRIKTAKLSKEDATAICLAFCNRIAEAGYTPMVYANMSMLTSQLNPEVITNSGYRIWLANYTTNTTYTGAYDFWQYSSTGKVDGISTNVDMNFYYAKPGDSFIRVTDSIASASVNPIPNQSYTGKAIKPAFTLTYEGQTLQQNVDYTIKYSNNTNLGTATITIEGTGKFKGTKQIFFKIVPGSVGTVKAKKRTTDSITISWSKNSKVSGYQIYRSTAIDGTYKKIKTISSKSTVTYKNTGLTDGERYYYKVRSYIKSGGKVYFGDFSPIATISAKSLGLRTAITKKTAYLYSQASSSAEITCTIPTGTSMPVSYITQDVSGKTWYYVTCSLKNVSIPQADGTTIQQDVTYKGFVPASRVTIERRGKVVKTNVVNVRKSYSIGSKILTTLKKNQKVTVLSTKQKLGTTWYKVTFKKGKKTYTGWISAPYVKLY